MALSRDRQDQIFYTGAGLLALVGKSRVSKVGKPERTVRTAQGSVAALKGQR